MELISVVMLSSIVAGVMVLGGLLLVKQFLANERASRHADTELITRQALKEAQEQLLVMAKEKLGGETEAARQELTHKQEVIAKMVEEVRKDLLKNQEHLKVSDERHAATFASISKELETYQQITKDLRGSTEDLKKVLSNNQLRGAFGEQVAENLLRMAGFVVGQDYVFNKEQEHTETRPDFTIFLPDKTKINVDAKFPYTALVKASATEDKSEKDLYYKQFASDVRQKIKQVTSRDYINPEERTVDFVILFIPNEMIFSFIYDQLNEVWEEAMMKKVVFAGPFSFTALLRMVKQAYTNFRYQENVHHVIGLIQKFEVEHQKYNEALDDLGKKINETSKKYESLAGTRTRVMNKIFDQIKNEQIIPQEEKKILLD